MVVLVTGCALFVTSQYDFIFAFPNQRLAKFVDTTCILFYTHSLLVVIQCVNCHCIEHIISAPIKENGAKHSIQSYHKSSA